MAASTAMHTIAPPSPWVVRWASAIPAGGTVLDLACGSGRHTRYLLSQGLAVLAVDRDLAGVADLTSAPRFESMQADLESGAPWPLAERRFAGVVVTNYLHRPIMAKIVAAVAPGGVLIYETFAQGNERLGKPSNPDFLLRSGELLDHARPALEVLAYEALTTQGERPAVIQRIAARRPA
jgi:SAM-dependent methyltransferase